MPLLHQFFGRMLFYQTFGSGVFQDPSFGQLSIFADNLYCRSSKTSYEKPIRKTKDRFYVEECEVFQVVQVI